MRKIEYHYPGDLPATCEVLTRAEFLEQYPSVPIKICTAAGVTEIPVSLDEVICDFCNDDPGDEVFVLHGYGICRRCAEKTVFPYVVDQGGE